MKVSDKKIMAMSLEELLVVLAVSGILTMIILDSWRMINDVRRRLMKEIDRGAVFFDTTYSKSTFILDELEKSSTDSLIKSQKNNEKTIE